MKIHEYQAKKIITKYDIQSPQSFLALTPEQAKDASSKIGKKTAVKAQVHVGGRGKAGGVEIADNPDAAFDAAMKIIGMDIKGITVEKVMVVEAIDVAKEYYIRILISDFAISIYSSMIYYFLKSKT